MAFRTCVLLSVLMQQSSASVCPNASETVELVVGIAPKCFQGCPQLCQPMEALATEFLTSGDVAAIKKKVCHAKQEFDCVFDSQNIDECKKVLETGSSVGIALPTSELEFKEQCESMAAAAPSSTSAFLAKTPEITMQATTAPASTGENTSMPKPECTGDNPIVQAAIGIAPQCFERCPYMCGILETVASKFGAGGPDKAVIEQQICNFKDDVGCIFQPSNKAACQDVLAAGSSFGVPESAQQLSRLCSGDGKAHDMSFGVRLSTAAAFLMPLLAAMLSM